MIIEEHTCRQEPSLLLLFFSVTFGIEIEQDVCICSEVTLLIMLCIVKRLVWAGDMICGSERLVDSDEETRELL